LEKEELHKILIQDAGVLPKEIKLKLD